MFHRFRLPRALAPLAVLAAIVAILAGQFAPGAAAQTGYPPPADPIGAIVARMVDAETGDPLQGLVQLQYCSSYGCYVIANGYTAPDGVVRFENSVFASPYLLAGTYLLEFAPQGYDVLRSPSFTVAAGQIYDYGTAQLQRSQRIAGVRGRVVDSETGQPITSLAGQVSASLLSCSDASSCSYLNTLYLYADGTFQYDALYSYTPVNAGLYAVEIYGRYYQTLRTEPTYIGGNEYKDFGTLAVTSVPAARSISGRVVDSITGAGISALDYPYLNISLQRCLYGSCFESVYPVTTDGNGNFSITSAEASSPLVLGSYQLRVMANEYNYLVLPIELSIDDQDLQLGNVLMQPYPVRFGAAQGCESLPASGGQCEYSIKMTSGLTGTMQASVWTIVGVVENYRPYPLANSGGSSYFQPDPARTVLLKSGASETLSFKLRVPAGASSNTTICAAIYVSGDMTTRMFKTIGQRDIFCLYTAPSGALQRMTEAQLRDYQRDGRRPR